MPQARPRAAVCRRSLRFRNRHRRHRDRRRRGRGPDDGDDRGHRRRRAGPRGPRCHGHPQRRGAHRPARRVHARRRLLPLPRPRPRVVRPDVRAGGLRDPRPRRRDGRRQPRDPDRRGARGRDRRGDGHRDRRCPGRRHPDDGAGERLRRRGAAGRPVRHRRVGRARPDVGRPHARLRRRRLPQEPADRVRELRHPQPEPHPRRRHRHDGGRRRHRLLLRLLLHRGVHDHGGRRRRGDDGAGLARHDDHEERRRRAQRHVPRRLRARELRGRQPRRGSGVARLHRQPEPALLRDPRRPGRPHPARPGLVLRLLQPLPHRQGGLRRRPRGGHRPRRLRQLRGQGDRAADRTGPVDRLHAVGAEGEAEAGAVDRRRSGLGAGAGELELGPQGGVAAHLERPDLHDNGGEALRVRLADGAAGRPRGPAAAPRHRDRAPERRRLVPGRRRRAAVHVRPLEAAGDGRHEPLRSRLRRQPRSQDRLRVPDRQRPVRVERQLRARPLPRRQRERPAVPRGPDHAVQHAGRGRDSVRQPQPAPRGVLPGHLAPHRAADAEPGGALRAAAHVLPRRAIEPALRRLLPDRGDHRADQRRLEHVGAPPRADVRARRAHGAEGALRPLLRQPRGRPRGRQPRQHVVDPLRVPRPERQRRLRRPGRAGREARRAGRHGHDAPDERHAHRPRPGDGVRRRDQTSRWSTSCGRTRRCASPTCART